MVSHPTTTAKIRLWSRFILLVLLAAVKLSDGLERSVEGRLEARDGDRTQNMEGP